MQGQLKTAGIFHFKQVRNGEVIDEWDSENQVVNEGLDYVLGTALKGVSSISTWYIGVYANTYAVSGTETASDVSGLTGEFNTEISEATRITWPSDAVQNQVVTNTGDAIVTSASIGDIVVRGAFLISENTKLGITGTLFCITNYDSPKTLSLGDKLYITYSVAATSS